MMDSKLAAALKPIKAGQEAMQENVDQFKENIDQVKEDMKITGPYWKPLYNIFEQK